MGPISKADVVNCDQFVTTNPPPSTLRQGHTQQYLLWTGKRDLSGKIVSIISLPEAGNPGQIWRMLRGRKSLSPSLLRPRLQQKGRLATARSKWMFNCKKIGMKSRQKSSTFEVEYNIDKRGRWIFVWWKNLQRNCFEPLCDNRLGEDSKIGRTQLKGLLCSSKSRGFVCSQNYFLVPNICMPHENWQI